MTRTRIFQDIWFSLLANCSRRYPIHHRKQKSSAKSMDSARLSSGLSRQPQHASQSGGVEWAYTNQSKLRGNKQASWWAMINPTISIDALLEGHFLTRWRWWCKSWHEWYLQARQTSFSRLSLEIYMVKDWEVSRVYSNWSVKSVFSCRRGFAKYAAHHQGN